MSISSPFLNLLFSSDSTLLLKPSINVTSRGATWLEVEPLFMACPDSPASLAVLVQEWTLEFCQVSSDEEEEEGRRGGGGCLGKFGGKIPG